MGGAVVDYEGGEGDAEYGCHLHQGAVDGGFGYFVGGIGVVVYTAVLNYLVGKDYFEFAARHSAGAFETCAQCGGKTTSFCFPKFIDAYACGVGFQRGTH